MITFSGKYTNANVMLDEIDESCANQIVQFINHPAFTNPVVIMPDTHAGAGSVIGFTMPLTDRIMPTTIGVDINCGMLSMEFNDNVTFNGESIDVPETINISRETIDKSIRTLVPFGTDVHKNAKYDIKQFPWNKAIERCRNFVMAFNKQHGTNMGVTEYNYEWFESKCKQIKMDVGRAINSIGTLGGGK